MDKVLAMAILGFGTAHIFGPGMNPPADSFEKNEKGEEQSNKTRSSSTKGEKETEKKKQSSRVAFAPAFDGIYCFETLVFH